MALGHGLWPLRKVYIELSAGMAPRRKFHFELSISSEIIPRVQLLSNLRYPCTTGARSSVSWSRRMTSRQAQARTSRTVRASVGGRASVSGIPSEFRNLIVECALQIYRLNSALVFDKCGPFITSTTHEAKRRFKKTTFR